MAIAANYLTTATFTGATALFTTPTSTSATYAYGRDLVLTNSGAVTIYVAVNTNTAAATTTGSFAIPTGGTVLLTQCAVPGGTIINGTAPSGTGSLSIGWASAVSVI